MRVRRVPALAVVLVALVTLVGCRKRKECSESFELLRQLDDRDLMRQADKPSDVEPIASYYEGVDKQFLALEPTLQDESVRTWVKNAEPLISKRVELLRAAKFVTRPGASPSPFAPPLLNTNATALEDNAHTIQAAHDDYFFKVCKP